MRVQNLFRPIFYTVLISLLIHLYSCKENVDYIPYVPVNFTVDLNRFNDLTSTGFSMKYPFDGYGGVIIYCEFYDVATPSNSVYHAFDATCTFEISDTCSVINEGFGLKAVCPCCSSTYTLYDGFPISGDASVPLKEYNISLLSNKLYVSN